MGVLNVQKSSRHGWCEYSWSDLTGIFNIYEVTSLVFWITKWRYGNIQKLTSWVFWNSYSLQEYSKYQSLWIFKISMSHIQNYTTWIFKIPMTSLQEYSKIPTTSAFEYSHDVTLWIFKIPMTSLHEYSKCLIWIFESCRHGYFEHSWCNWSFKYSRSDVMVIHEVTTWVIWVFMRWGQR